MGLQAGILRRTLRREVPLGVDKIPCPRTTRSYLDAQQLLRHERHPQGFHRCTLPSSPHPCLAREEWCTMLGGRRDEVSAPEANRQTGKILGLVFSRNRRDVCSGSRVLLLRAALSCLPLCQLPARTISACSFRMKPRCKYLALLMVASWMGCAQSWGGGVSPRNLMTVAFVKSTAAVSSSDGMVDTQF